MVWWQDAILVIFLVWLIAGATKLILRRAKIINETISLVYELDEVYPP